MALHPGMYETTEGTNPLIFSKSERSEVVSLRSIIIAGLLVILMALPRPVPMEIFGSRPNFCSFIQSDFERIIIP